MKHVALKVVGEQVGTYQGYQIVKVTAMVGMETVMVAQLVNKDLDWPKEVERWHHPDFTFSCLDMTVASGCEWLLARALQHPANVRTLNRAYRDIRNGI